VNARLQASALKHAFAWIAISFLTACTMACANIVGYVGGRRVPLRIPGAVILTPESPQTDLNVRAYHRAFEAMGLVPRSVSASAIGTLAPAREQLLVAVPARCASALDSSQTSALSGLIKQGATVVTEGYSPLAGLLGFRPGTPLDVAALQHAQYSEVPIEWEHAVRLIPPVPPGDAAILARDAATGVPIVSFEKSGKGGILILGTELDPEKGEGYARFPFLPQDLGKAGVIFPFRSERLSALFDWGFRRDADLEALAHRWRRAGIKVIHAGAWAFFDDDPAMDKYLESLITACHHNGILVFAWFELPHVSRNFWDQHPDWREKTARGEDAHLDWRLLMNLKDPQCFAAVLEGMRRQMRRFDWDGANSAEIYFDSPNGPSSPELFTPLNSLVRSDVKERIGIDPLEFFRAGSPHSWKKDRQGWEAFVEYRVVLERDLNERVLRELGAMKNASGEPLGLAVTYVDDLYDAKMREAVGADVRGMMPLLDRYDFTLILEDPGTVWHLGPRRYAELAAGYSKLTSRVDRLGIDINIVDRERAAYPTAKQTGLELMQLFYNAGMNFETVMVYSEQTIYDWDLDLVANAMAGGASATMVGGELAVASKRPVTLRTGADSAEFHVDGKLWPCVAGGDVLLPAGDHGVAAFAARKRPLPRLINLNGDLQGAAYDGTSAFEFRYRSRHRGAAVFNQIPRTLLIDGAGNRGSLAEWILLPGGTHRVHVSF